MNNRPLIERLDGKAALQINRVLKNTYLLLSMTLLFSAAAAWFSLATNAPPVGLALFLIGAFGLQFLTTSLRNSSWGILAAFAFTGFLGYTLGPVLNMYISSLSNGAEIVYTALGATGCVFLGLSLHAISSGKNYSYMGGFIAAASIIAFIGLLGGFLFKIPMMVLLVSGVWCVISSAYILYTTSQIIHGGETNYIMATVSLYVAIFNLFVSLLRILSFFAGNRD